MIIISSMKDKKLALFGLGGSGLATAKALKAGGAELVVWDDNAAAVKKAETQGFAVEDLRKYNWSGTSALILSPGVPLTHPKPHWSVGLARRAKVEIIGDIELFCRERAAFLAKHKNLPDIVPFIAITGTNGKSTTTALTAHMLAAAGYDVEMGGNIGKPALELEPFKASAKQVYVLEISSYQIDLAPSLEPSVGVVLNITPDHIDRHGSFKNYKAVKARLAEKSAKAIINCGDNPCLALHEKLQKSGKQPVAVKADNNDGYITEPLYYKYFLKNFYNKDGELLQATLLLHSPHNAQNALCALAACTVLGAKNFEKGLKDFRGLPHRLQEVAEENYKGVKIRFINDSKATNAQATAPALQSFNQIYWLAGGRAKTGGITSLMKHQYMVHVRGAYFFGEAAAEFQQAAQAYFSNISGRHLPGAFEQMDIALYQAVKDVKADIDGSEFMEKEAVILLSPACASFDQFKNFEERGEIFTDLARNYCQTVKILP